MEVQGSDPVRGTGLVLRGPQVNAPDFNYGSIANKLGGLLVGIGSR